MCYWYMWQWHAYPELDEEHSNMDGDIIMHKLPKDGAVRAGWSNAKLKHRKQ